jgi:hypothetical protein
MWQIEDVLIFPFFLAIFSTGVIIFHLIYTFMKSEIDTSCLLVLAKSLWRVFDEVFSPTLMEWLCH